MASKTIRGLTVEINGDTKKLSEALKAPEKQLKSLTSELTDINKLLRFDPSNTDALTQKTELLSKAIASCADKLDILRLTEQKMAAMTERTEKEEEQYRALQREIMETESKIGNYTKQLNGAYAALDKLGEATDEAKTAIQRMKDEAEEAKTTQQRWAESMAEVNTQSSKLSKELNDINKRLKDDANNTELLVQKKQALAEMVQECAEKLLLLKEREVEVQAAMERGEDMGAEYRELRREIMDADDALDSFTRELAETDSKLLRMANGLDEAAEEADDMGDKSKTASKQVDELGDKVKDAGDKASHAGGGFTVFKGAIADLLADGLREMVECLKELGKYMAQTGIDFGQTMSKVEALIDPAERTTENLDALTQKAMEMGAKTKFSANESAQAFTYLAQAGWDTEQMLAGIDGVMALAATDGIELAQAAEITAQAINALGYEAEDASTFADLLAVTSAATCTNVEEMGYAFQYVGPVAGALGFEMDDLAIAIGAMADAGITGQKAGTSLRSLFTNMAKPTAAMSAAMEEYGISLTDASGSMLPLTDIMDNLRTVFSGLTEEQKTNLAATLAGKTGMAGLLSIVNAAPEDYEDLTNAIGNSKDAAGEMAAVMQDNLAGDIEKLGGAFETLSVKIMQGFDEPLRQATQAITAFLDGEMTMKELLVELTDAVAQMGQKFREYLPTLVQVGKDLLVYLVNGIVAGLPALMTAATDLVANLCTFIAQNASTIMNVAGSLLTSFVQGIFNFIPTLITGAAEIVASLAKGIQGNTSSFVSKALDLLDGFADKLTSALPKLIKSGMDFILNMVKGLMQALPEFIQRAPEIISKFANLINDNVPTLLSKGVAIIWEIIKGIVKAIPDLIANAPKIIAAIVDVWEAFNWLSLGKKAIELLGKGVKAMVGFVKSAGTSIKDGVVNAIKNLPDNLMNLGQKAANGLGNAIKAGVSNAKTAAKAIFDGVVNTFKTLPSKMLEIGKNLVEGLWNGISDMAGWIVNKVMGFGSSVLEAIRGVFQEHSPSRATALSGKNLVLGLAEGIDDNAKEAIKSAESLAANVLDGASMDGLALERSLHDRTIKHAMSVTTAADSSMLSKLDKILTAIEKGQIITLDGKALVGGTVGAYDTALGQRRLLAARGAV